MLSKKNFIELSLVFTVFFLGCKKDNVVDIKPVKDPRTYSWTADTLGYPGSYQTLMTDIWGSSHNDVYVVGHNSLSSGVMWHYDGNSWTSVRLISLEGGQIEGAIDLTSIYGFSSTDIYAAGTSISYNPNPPPTFASKNLIIHYDGSTWRKVNVDNSGFLDDIYGSSPNNIWASGGGTKFFHSDGNKWETDSVNIKVPSGFSFQINSISSNSSSFYLLGNSNNNTTGETMFYFFKRVNNAWVAQDSFSSSNSSNRFGGRLNQSNLPDLYSNGSGGMYIYNNSSWVKISNSPDPIYFMWGTSSDNIFAVSNGSRAYHYNGTDWKQIEQLNDPKIDYYAVWTDGTEAFVVGHIYDGVYMKTIVWHGK